MKQFYFPIFKVEVGVLLDKSNDEYESYSQVYDKQHGFYDENVVFFTNSAKAAEFALSYVMKGVVNTYAIVSDIIYRPADVYGDNWEKEWKREKKEIEETGSLEGYADIFEGELYDTKHIVLDIYQSEEKTIKFDFIKK